MFRRSFLGLGILQAIGTILGIRIPYNLESPITQYRVSCVNKLPDDQIKHFFKQQEFVHWFVGCIEPYKLVAIAVQPVPNSTKWEVTETFRRIESPNPYGKNRI